MCLESVYFLSLFQRLVKLPFLHDCNILSYFCGCSSRNCMLLFLPTGLPFFPRALLFLKGQFSSNVLNTIYEERCLWEVNCGLLLFHIFKSPTGTTKMPIVLVANNAAVDSLQLFFTEDCICKKFACRMVHFPLHLNVNGHINAIKGQLFRSVETVKCGLPTSKNV